MQISTFWKQLRRCSRSLAVAMAFAGSSLSAFAAEQQYLTIIFQDGSKQSYTLNDRPKVTFNNTTLFVKAQEVENDFVLKDVHKFVFTDTSETGISNVSENEFRFSFTDGENVVLEGHAADTAVRLYDTAGKAVRTASADAEGRATVSLAGLQAGVYVINTADGKTYKVIKH